MGRIMALSETSVRLARAFTHTGGFPERESSANRADLTLARSRKGFFIGPAATRRYRTLASATHMRHLFWLLCIRAPYYRGVGELWFFVKVKDDTKKKEMAIYGSRSQNS